MGFLSSANPLMNPFSVENAINSQICEGCEKTRETQPTDVEGCNKDSVMVTVFWPDGTYPHDQHLTLNAPW